MLIPHSTDSPHGTTLRALDVIGAIPGTIDTSEVRVGVCHGVGGTCTA